MRAKTQVVAPARVTPIALPLRSAIFCTSAATLSVKWFPSVWVAIILIGEPLALEKAALERDDHRPGHRIVAQHRGADLDRRLRTGGARERGHGARRGGGGQESTP